MAVSCRVWCVTFTVVSPRIFLPLFVCVAVCATGPERLYARAPNEKAARVLEPLLKRPGPGPLFERFINAWLDTGTLEELNTFLTERVTADPSTPNRLLLALLYSRQGESVKALEQFRAALVTAPGSADIWYQKALVESRTLDFDAALAKLGKCLAAGPSTELSLRASQLHGRLLSRAGRTDDALKAWQALIAARRGLECRRAARVDGVSGLGAAVGSADASVFRGAGGHPVCVGCLREVRMGWCRAGARVVEVVAVDCGRAGRRARDRAPDHPAHRTGRPELYRFQPR